MLCKQGQLTTVLLQTLKYCIFFVPLQFERKGLGGRGRGGGIGLSRPCRSQSQVSSRFLICNASVILPVTISSYNGVRCLECATCIINKNHTKKNKAAYALFHLFKKRLSISYSTWKNLSDFFLFYVSENTRFNLRLDVNLYIEQYTILVGKHLTVF